MLRLRYLSSQVTVSQCSWPPPGRFATSNSASWLLDCEASRKTTSLLYSTPLELSFADSIAWGHNSVPDGGRALNPHTPPHCCLENPHPTLSLSFTLSHFSNLILPVFIFCTVKCSWAFCLKKNKNQQRPLNPLNFTSSTLLTQLGVDLTNDSDKVLQQGAPTTKCFLRKLSWLRVEVRYY